MSQPARVLVPADVRRLAARVKSHRHPVRDHAIILLSFKAGLRACEIAGLDWSMVLRPDGRLDHQVAVSRHIAKNGSARRLPMHSDLKQVLARLHFSQGAPRSGPVVRSERGCHMTARSIVNWFARLYAAAGLIGCSSHSGRRTFITRSARLLSHTGGSLRDIQELAGHRSLSTTERYIAGDRDAQRKLIRLV
ncbi:site-specific integrase [uncultured Sphingomonas sp.]|uniref:tyrosine-type recombinase/integrase n=1 Tax=uncultured Sphingomonas sp. TaxID=158754 RepID=UPI0025CFF847|nr:site-specific integrase [uncultured Sphingomonas sp.]